MRIFNLLLVSFLFFSSANAQPVKIEYGKVLKAFQSNNYEDVLSLSQYYLDGKVSTNKDTLISIYEMRAVSYFALSKKEESKKSFIEILKLKSIYEPDPVLISPKIIQFFQPIKSDFFQIVNTPKPSKPDTSSLTTDFDIKQQSKNYIFNTSFRSVVLPGWGHLYSGQNTKGIILMSLSSLLIGSSVYYIIHTNKLENDYIFESDKIKIAEKYSKYNSAYKIRNTLLISYAAIWLFSQLDLFIFSADNLYNNFSFQIWDMRSNSLVSDFKLSFNLTF